jgi:ribonuclease VapC
MVIDSSALLAILLDEPERAIFRSAIARSGIRLTSVATVFETSMVLLGRLGEPGLAALTALLTIADIASVPFDLQQGALALDAFRRFGKGRNPARLNLGDCISYALAKSTGEPLLFKGDDFLKTDVKRAV